jgi:3-hydroxyacyl-[acyl-carrier-protein] dehydratase
MTSDNTIHLPINIDKIIKLLPHRYPFLLVDRVIALEPKKKVVAIKNVTFNEPQFTGHFPDKPIMPGVMIIEAMAQAATLMVTADPAFNYKDSLVYFMSIEGAKFRKPVVPGDTLELHVETTQNRSNAWKMSGVGIVQGQKVAEAQFSAMIVEKSKALQL